MFHLRQHNLWTEELLAFRFAKKKFQMCVSCLTTCMHVGSKEHKSHVAKMSGYGTEILYLVRLRYRNIVLGQATLQKYCTWARLYLLRVLF